jgi:hypothetical protein
MGIGQVLGIVAPHLFEEPLWVLAADEHLELDAEREVGREGVDDPELASYLRIEERELEAGGLN